jgi:predicted GIY-YIG superfamily endonuclease
MSTPEVYILYILYCHDKNCRIRSYVGITNNLPRRLKQHRGVLSGGAKYTSRLREQGATWILGATAHFFSGHQEVLCLEWSLQHPGRSRHLKGRRASVGSQNAYLRNIDNLFFITHEVTRYGHISAVVHSAPQGTLLEIVQRKYKKFTVIPERLLLERSYPEFINNYNASLGHSQIPSNGNKAHVPKRQQQPQVALNPRAAKYREEARRLLARSRLVIDLRGD